MFGLPGNTEILILIAIVFLLFGSSQLPKLARSLGRSKVELQRGLREGINEADAEANQAS